jgi:hypothetical protein
MKPDVVYMRFVRDRLIGYSSTGRMLVDAFNAFYYSWSPSIAEVIAGSESLRAAFRVLILPLVWIVHGTAFSFGAVSAVTGSADVASVVAFLLAVLMFIASYLILPLLVGVKLVRSIRRRSCLPRAQRGKLVLQRSN